MDPNVPVRTHELPRGKAALAGTVTGIGLGLAALWLRISLPDWLPLLGWLGVSLVATVVLHEGVHGLVARALGHRPAFGVEPPRVFVTFRKRVPRNHFVAIAAAPLIVLNVVFLGLYALDVLSTFFLLCFAINTIGSWGDVWMIARLLPYPSEVMVRDTRTGFEVRVPDAAGVTVRRQVVAGLASSSEFEMLAAALSHPQIGDRVIDDFEVTEMEALEGGLRRYHFRFTDLCEPNMIAHTLDEREALRTPVREGWIVLDEDLRHVRDEDGGVQLGLVRKADEEREHDSG